jgi:hypothetical protein
MKIRMRVFLEGIMELGNGLEILPSKINELCGSGNNLYWLASSVQARMRMIKMLCGKEGQP